MGQAATTQDAAALTLAGATPHSVVDVMLECVLEARFRYGALCADPLSHQHAHPVIGKEHVRLHFSALALRHPIAIHHPTPFLRTF